MLEAALGCLEGGGHVEDLLAVLDGDDAAVGEAVAIEAAVDFVDDRRVAVAAPQEVGMQRVHHARLDRRRRRRQRLAEHLPAEDLRAADVAALAAEQIDLELLELEQLQQIREALIHGASAPRSRRLSPALPGAGA